MPVSAWWTSHVIWLYLIKQHKAGWWGAVVRDGNDVPPMLRARCRSDWLWHFPWWITFKMSKEGSSVSVEEIAADKTRQVDNQQSSVEEYNAGSISETLLIPTNLNSICILFHFCCRCHPENFMFCVICVTASFLVDDCGRDIIPAGPPEHVSTSQLPPVTAGSNWLGCHMDPHTDPSGKRRREPLIVHEGTSHLSMKEQKQRYGSEFSSTL